MAEAAPAQAAAMTAAAGPNDAAPVGTAVAELARLTGRVEAMRAVLIRLLQDVVRAESRLDNSQATQLLQANEQLVLASLRAHSDSEMAALALDEASRSAGLDALTGLPNRALLLDRLAQAIANAKRHGHRLALLFVDLDHFKQLNDTLGHAAGDAALLHAARCLTSSVRAADTVSRHGGDEFLILLAELSQPADASVIAEKVLEAIGTQIRIGEQVVRLSASVGISVYPDDASHADALIERADAAMYRAKRKGPGRYAFGDDAAGVDPRPPAAVPAETPQARLHRYELALAAQDRRLLLLQEANEKLLLAALGAQELQATAEQAQRRQTRFLAAVAQELRNPLASIRMAMAMLGRVHSDEPLLPRAQALIGQQAGLISHLMSELLEAAHPGAPATELERRPLDMAAVIDAAVQAWLPTLDGRRQALVLELPPGPFAMNGDPARLMQLLVNLLNNASRYTPDTGTIELSAAIADDQLVLTVADDGIGISAEALPAIFDPFVQDAHAVGYNGAGLGIGLTVVRQIVDAHGGSVVASSAGHGLGSRYVVTLPLVQRPVA